MVDLAADGDFVIHINLLIEFCLRFSNMVHVGICRPYFEPNTWPVNSLIHYLNPIDHAV